MEVHLYIEVIFLLNYDVNFFNLRQSHFWTPIPHLKGIYFIFILIEFKNPKKINIGQV